MDLSLSQLFSVETIIFCIVIYVAVFVLRKVSEGVGTVLSPRIPQKYLAAINEIWREWALPALPIVAGATVAYYFSSYPFPAAFATSETGRMFYGVVCGMASGYVYRFFKFYINKFLPDNVQAVVNKIELPPSQ